MITIRGHHLFCLLEPLCGIDLPNALFNDHKTLNSVADKILENPGMQIKIIVGPDDICLPCQYWDNAKGYCIKSPEEQPGLYKLRMQLDKASLQSVKIIPGSVFSPIDVYIKIKENVLKDIFQNQICKECPDISSCSERYDEKLRSAIERLYF